MRKRHSAAEKNVGEVVKKGNVGDLREEHVDAPSLVMTFA